MAKTVEHLPAPHQHKRDEHGHDHGHITGERFYIHRHSPVHAMVPHLKILAVFLFVLAVVVTPRTAYWVFALDGLLLLGVIKFAKLRYREVLPRLVVEVPFLLFAVLMPFFGTGEKVEVLGLSLYKAGLIAGGAILIKGTLGVLASVILGATTTAKDIIAGLQRLRFPSLIVEIASFMLRYVAVVTDELQRMTIAQQSRGFLATGPKQWRAIARTSGALFIRSYERGERVHLAMLARGYSGTLPQMSTSIVTRREILMTIALPATALTLALLAIGGLL
jgi:cobalt/nickel transport system permease protein